MNGQSRREKPMEGNVCWMADVHCRDCEASSAVNASNGKRKAIRDLKACGWIKCKDGFWRCVDCANHPDGWLTNAEAQ